MFFLIAPPLACSRSLPPLSGWGDFTILCFFFLCFFFLSPTASSRTNERLRLLSTGVCWLQKTRGKSNQRLNWAAQLESEEIKCGFGIGFSLTQCHCASTHDQEMGSSLEVLKKKKSCPSCCLKSSGTGLKSDRSASVLQGDVLH